MSKILSFSEAPSVMGRLRGAGKKIVQCHGTFDLVHPGHLIHFEEARAHGDVLVVTLTGESHVNKGPGRPYFGDRLRVKMLESLSIVDHVVVIPFPAAVEAIECIRPHVYCKGKEYEDPRIDVTGNIRDDLDTVERLGGVVRYVGSEVYSSTRLINKHFDPYPADVKAFLQEVAAEMTANELREVVDSFKDLRILVVGEIIFDRYTTVSVQGLSSKSRILSGRFISEDTQAGGALAILRHLRQFTPHVKLASVVGTEKWTEELLARHLKPGEDALQRSTDYTTIVKQRFVEPGAKLVSKLFSVNYIDAEPPPERVERPLRASISSIIRDFDVCLVADFGHGLMSDALRELVQDQAPMLALNCQTNSNNHGFNIINRQYRRADCFSLDETEIRLAMARRHVNFKSSLDELRRALGSDYAWLTRGAVQTIGLRADGSECVGPPLEKNVTDPVGAGDAFCSLVSMAAARRIPIKVATFLGQLAGAQAVQIVGNADAIRKDRLLQSGMAMLKS